MMRPSMRRHHDILQLRRVYRYDGLATEIVIWN